MSKVIRKIEEPGGVDLSGSPTMVVTMDRATNKKVVSLEDAPRWEVHPTTTTRNIRTMTACRENVVVLPNEGPGDVVRWKQMFRRTILADTTGMKHLRRIEVTHLPGDQDDVVRWAHPGMLNHHTVADKEREGAILLEFQVIMWIVIQLIMGPVIGVEDLQLIEGHADVAHWEVKE